MTLLYDWLKTSAKARGNNKALVYRDNYLSWRGLLHRVDRRAQEFKSMGVAEGAWVGLMLGNVPDFVILGLALSKLGATVVPIDPTTGARELELIMAAAPLRALVTRPRGSEATSGAAQREEAEEEVPEIRRRLQGTLLTCSVFKRPNPDFGDTALAVMFTADSNGDPKGVLRTEENIRSTVDNLTESLSIDTDSRILTAVPLFHAYGWDIGLLPVLATGATMFLEEEISARRVAKLLRDHTIDIMPGTPVMYGELSKLPMSKPLSVKSPRFLSSGSNLDGTVAEEFASKYGVRIMSCYHTTESAVVAIDAVAKNPATVGKIIDGIEMRISPLKGSRSKSKGVIWLRGESLSPRSIGPFQDFEGPAKKGDVIPVGGIDKDGWFRTGDIGQVDRGKRLSLIGREDDVVKVEGKRVALGEVEGCIENFPMVKEAKARLEEDPYTGNMVVAEVIVAGTVEAEDIIDHCARNLAPYKVPRRIEFTDAFS